MPSLLDIRVSRVIKKIRKKHGLSVQALAKELCVSRMTICYWENDLFSPSRRNINKIIKIYGVNKKEFFL